MTQPPSRFVFGLVPTEATLDTGLNTLLRWLGDRAGIPIVRRHVPSYDALAQQMTSSTIDVAWLPPLIFVGLERDAVAVPLVTNQRHGKTLAVLIARVDARVRDLDTATGARIAWVDPLSASGYVLPRLQLAALGFDPRTMFAHEHFYGSHSAAAHAVIAGSADIAATFAGLNADGDVIRSGWSDLNEADARSVRILATLGEVPPDLIAIRANIGEKAREPLALALTEACGHEPLRPIIKRVFGAEAFSTEGFASYEQLRLTLDGAAEADLLDATAPYSKTMPPPPVR